MKRIPFRLLLVLAMAVAALLPAFATAQPPLPGPCDLHRNDGESVRAFSKRQIGCAVERFGPVRGGVARAICIAKRESGLDPTATSEPTGEYRGLFQHDRDFWPWRYDTYTKPTWELSPRVLNGRTNAIVTIRMVADFGAWKAAGWPPKDC
jgi:hypothetical protein